MSESPFLLLFLCCDVVQWLEYFLAYCGALAFEGDPIEWAKNHTCEQLSVVRAHNRDDI
jgi:hypothetical protein